MTLSMSAPIVTLILDAHIICIRAFDTSLREASRVNSATARLVMTYHIHVAIYLFFLKKGVALLM